MPSLKILLIPEKFLVLLVNRLKGTTIIFDEVDAKYFHYCFEILIAWNKNPDSNLGFELDVIWITKIKAHAKNLLNGVLQIRSYVCAR